MNHFINPIKIYDGTLLHLVPHEPDNGYQFYVSGDGKIGLRISPKGVETVVNATPTTTENCKVQYNAKREQRYLTFHDAFGYHKDILVSHAVYRAWVGPIDKPCIDHKNGVTTDNRWQNLEPVTYAENSRRTTILKGLRQVGINPAELPFSVLDKYLDPGASSRRNGKSGFRLEGNLPAFIVGTPLDCGAEPNKYADPFIERD